MSRWNSGDGATADELHVLKNKLNAQGTATTTHSFVLVANYCL
jgi:hypothetical protein